MLSIVYWHIMQTNDANENNARFRWGSKYCVFLNAVLPCFIQVNSKIVQNASWSICNPALKRYSLSLSALAPFPSVSHWLGNVTNMRMWIREMCIAATNLRQHTKPTNHHQAAYKPTLCIKPPPRSCILYFFRPVFATFLKNTPSVWVLVSIPSNCKYVAQQERQGQGKC